jgi:hypothetical protein
MINCLAVKPRLLGNNAENETVSHFYHKDATSKGNLYTVRRPSFFAVILFDSNPPSLQPPSQFAKAGCLLHREKKY